MVLYHGTKKEYLDSILENGLLRGHNSGDNTYIYLTDNIMEAKKWGEIVFKIDARGLDLRCFQDEIPVWQILCAEDINTNRIKLIKN